MRVALILSLATGLCAQQVSPGGIAPAWDTPKLFTAVNALSARLKPLFRQIQVQEWKEAPASFAALLKDTSDRNAQLPTRAQALASHPERLAESLRLLLEIEAVDRGMAVLIEGVRSYQNPALAEVLASVRSEDAPLLEAWKQRVLDLAAEREQQFAVADHEAQRCREQLSKKPASPSARPRKVESKQ